MAAFGRHGLGESVNLTGSVSAPCSVSACGLREFAGSLREVPVRQPILKGGAKDIGHNDKDQGEDLFFCDGKIGYVVGDENHSQADDCGPKFS